MKLKDKLRELHANKSAILATNFYNFETLQGILKAVKSSGQPIILQLTQSSIDYMGLENCLALARAGLKSAGIEGWVHLDHANSYELVERCLHAGFDSVMIDGSELPFEQNIELTRRVVKLAEQFDANVEAELGYVAKLGQSTDKVAFTEPEDAKTFVAETGINALAVAIGTVHGFYKSEPKLDFARLEQINGVANACLVLHGGSGVPHEQVRRAVELGITKINVATELKDAFMRKLKDVLSYSKEIDLRKVFPPAIDAVSGIVESKLNIIAQGEPDAAGRSKVLQAK